MTTRLFLCFGSPIALFPFNSLSSSPPLLSIPIFPSAPSLLSPSDYIIKEKTVLLQKKDNEGFGFVLRGAKGEPFLQNSPYIFLSLEISESHMLYFFLYNLCLFSFFLY